MPDFTKIADFYRKHGAFSLLWAVLDVVYSDHVRPRMPRRVTRLNGIEVRAERYLDGVFPWTPTFPRPEYEGPLVAGLREIVEPGDVVVIVGGGWGVSTVVAAQETGSSGSVTTFEGAEREARYVAETAALNDVSDEVSVVHAVVGAEKDLRSDSGGELIGARTLPTAEVLLLDCEGAEETILSELAYRPRNIVVETHENFDSSSSDVRSVLESKGYAVVSEEEVDSERGIDVLVAAHSPAEV